MKPALILPVLMTALIGLSFSCSKSDSTSEVLLPQEPEFRDVNRTMEDWIPLEAEGNYHNYFRFQNASDHTFYFNVSTKYGSEPLVTYIRPGEQGTDLITLAKAPITGLTEAQITDLSLKGWITFWVNAPAPGEFPPIVGGRPGQQRWLADDLDTMAQYSFYDGLEYNSKEATPKDPARWTFEKFNDHRVRWTYRITNEDHGVAVRQTLERWAKKDDKE